MGSGFTRIGGELLEPEGEIEIRTREIRKPSVAASFPSGGGVFDSGEREVIVRQTANPWAR
jgi:hypothetical protein